MNRSEKRSDEVELSTTTLTIGGKRFNLDVKENMIGRFIKMRESAVDRNASKIILPCGGALSFNTALLMFASPKVARKVAPVATEDDGRAPPIHSESFMCDTKKFHLDLFQNQRGRVLKISCVCPKGRESLMVPADNNGIEELCNAFQSVMKEAGEGIAVASLSALGVSGNAAFGKVGEGDIEIGKTQVQIGTNRYFLSLKQNKIGRFLKITEVTDKDTREKIIIPVANARHFRNVLFKIINMDIKEKVIAKEDLMGRQKIIPPLFSESMKTDNRLVFFDLKAHTRGRILKISVKGGETKAAITVPGKTEQLELLCKALDDMLALDMPQKKGVYKPAPSDETLAECSVQVQHKKFFVTLKSNLRGKHLKITESSGNKIIIPAGAIVPFFEAMLSSLGKHVRTPSAEISETDSKANTNVVLHSSMMEADDKKFYVDLVENSRGRALKVSQIAMDERVVIFLPAVGLESFVTSLTSALRASGEIVMNAAPIVAGGAIPGKPGEGTLDVANKLVPIEGKRFFVDLKENEIGRFIQLSEVTSQGDRNKINIPVAAIGEMHGVLGSFADLDMSGLVKGQAYLDNEGHPITLRSAVVKLDRAILHFDLNANVRGCVLKITSKDNKGGRTTLMVPSSGLKRLQEAFANIYI